MTATAPAGASLHPAAERLARRLPRLMVDAEKLAATLLPGPNPQARAGAGAEFWQYRPAEPGEPAQRIDWRRSARSDTLYVREAEAESPHKLVLWADQRAAMFTPSQHTQKGARGFMMALALSLAAKRAGENVQVVGASREGDMGTRILSAGGAWAMGAPVSGAAHVLILSDFYEPIALWKERLAALGVAGRKGTLIAVRSPEETLFAFAGRTRFQLPGAPGTYLEAGRAEAWREAFITTLDAHETALDGLAAGLGWALIRHRTDEPIAPAALAAHRAIAPEQRVGA